MVAVLCYHLTVCHPTSTCTKYKKRSLFSFDFQSQMKQKKSSSRSLIRAGVWSWDALNMSYVEYVELQTQKWFTSQLFGQVSLVEQSVLPWNGLIHAWCSVECTRISSAENLWIFVWKRKTIQRKLTETPFHEISIATHQLKLWSYSNDVYVLACMAHIWYLEELRQGLCTFNFLLGD